MDKERKRSIIEEELSQKLRETGCFVNYRCAEGYDNIEYRWDFVRLIVDEGWNYVRMDVGTFAGEVPIMKLPGCKYEYNYETEAEFREGIQHIYNSFVDIIGPKAEEMVKEEWAKEGCLGNRQTIKWLEENMEKFEVECEENSDETIYSKIVETMKKSQILRRKPHITEMEIDEFIYLELLACVEFGEWIIRTQGGHWKTKHPRTGYNQLVLVHPRDEKKMVDLCDLLRKRCMKRGLTPAFSYKKDLDFWKNIK